MSIKFEKDADVIQSTFNEYLFRTYVKSTMPVLAMAKDKPRMPLPMMALLKLKTDIPKEVWPGCCSETKSPTEETILENDINSCLWIKIALRKLATDWKLELLP